MAKKRILGVIGLGHVGAHVAYALAVQGIADELILIDKNEQKLASEIQDLRDAAAYLPHRVSFQAGEFSDLGECDVIVNCVGKIELLRESHDRTTEMDFTIPAVRGFAEKIKKSGFNGVVINITNPCDIVTHELALGLGLPKGRVFGTGTGLDTARLLSALARQTGIDHKSITYCTEYGIATTAARMAHIVLHDEKAIMPASAELCGEYGESGLFAGVPCVLGANGVEQIVELPLTAEEQAQFHACCDGIRANMEHWKNIRNI